MKWEVPELEDLNRKFRQDDEESPYYTGYGACVTGSGADSCVPGGAGYFDPTW
jgi:hypothetical protein